MSELSLSSIKIRTELLPGDLGNVTYLHGKLYTTEYGFGPEFEHYVAEGFLEFVRHYDPACNRIWACEHEGRLIGFMLLMNRGSAAQLRYFLIEHAYRGIGLGKHLMKLFMEF